MENIQFIGRKNELEEIEKSKKKGSFFLVVNGRRRIGKTSLLRKAFPESVYMFIWPNKSLSWICDEICKENGLPEFRNFKDIITYLLDKGKIIVFDEFQNFLNVDKSVYGEIQKIIDDRKAEKKPYRIAVAGSSYSLMRKVFNDSASPLYGRRTQEINLSGLQVTNLYRELNISLEEFFKLWSVFEGVPYYYELIDKNKKSEKNISDLVISKNAQLREEGRAILSVEFGGDSKIYDTLLSGISQGKTRFNEIVSLFGNKKSYVIKYIDVLRKDFELIRRITPILEEPKKSRQGKYEINDNFLSFWFLFVDKQRNLIEQERYEEVHEIFKNNFNTFLGRKFEKFILLLLKEDIISFSDFDGFNKLGAQWGKIPNFNKNDSKQKYEIDILGRNKDSNKTLFGECKWQEKVNPEKIFRDLEEKSKYININKNTNKKQAEDRENEIFVIFAKSFSKKINQYNGKKVYCIDLKDIEKSLEKN